MKKEYFEILISILKIALMITTIYILPKLKQLIEENTTAKQRQELVNFSNIGIKIAEQYYKEKNKGKDKKEFVINYLKKAGIKINQEQINQIIDMIVSWYNVNGWDKNISKEVI
ncbi:MAG: phage holin, LLH family [Peptoanaerobacter stomatis]|uniref:phage holin, LLH family n=1 Tax=Peptoanaerobacter stomatis TaxID=796937 RepID=UPI003F9F8B84